MKVKHLIITLFYLFPLVGFSQAGWGDSFIEIDVNETGSDDFWIGADPSSGTEFDTHDFGEVSTIEITSVNMIYTNTVDDRTGGSFLYTIKSADGLTTIVSETEVEWTQTGPIGSSPYEYTGTASGLSINLLSDLEPNTEYQLSVRALSTGSGGDSNLDNGGSNYVANFTTSKIMVFGANSIADGTAYSSLKSTFDAINATANQSGKDIEVRIGTSVTEVATASLSDNNWNSLTIFPTVADLVIDADMGSAVIRLYGANNVTLDGRVNQTGSTPSLTVMNNSALGGAVAIDLLNSAQYNILQYTKFKGKLADNSRGVVFIGSASTGDGNDYNIIRYNEISGIDENNRPRHAIASNGNTSRENEYNQILNNKIFDFINKTASANGITMISGSDKFTISGNSFYETVEDFAPEGGYRYYAIRTNTNSVHTITNNYIGGNVAEVGGVWKTTKGVTDAHYSFTAIYVSGKTDEATLVQSNIINNFNIVTGGSTWNHDTWDGIFIDDGNVDVLSNTIGATTGTSSIYVEATHGSTIATAHGILNNSTGTVNITNNTMGSIEINGAVDYSHSFEGIYLRARANITYITDNLLGSTSESNSINVSGTANTSSYKQDVYGIYSASQNEVHILRNTLRI
jgi:hypothetical protein